MKRFLAMLGCVLLLATVPSKPYTFAPSTLIQSSQVNSDFDTLFSAFLTIDHSNTTGSTGFWASDINPTSTSAATFGSSYAYTFSNGLTVNGGLTLGTALGVAYGGTGATSLPLGPIYSTGTALASMGVATPVTFAGGTLGCGTCVTSVGGSGMISSTGGTTPVLSCSNCAPTYNGTGSTVNAHQVLQSYSITFSNPCNPQTACAGSTAGFSGNASYTSVNTFSCTLSPGNFTGDTSALVYHATPVTDGSHVGLSVQNTSTSSTITGFSAITVWLRCLGT